MSYVVRASQAAGFHVPERVNEQRQLAQACRNIIDAFRAMPRTGRVELSVSVGKVYCAELRNLLAKDWRTRDGQELQWQNLSPQQNAAISSLWHCVQGLLVWLESANEPRPDALIADIESAMSLLQPSAGEPERLQNGNGGEDFSGLKLPPEADLRELWTQLAEGQRKGKSDKEIARKLSAANGESWLAILKTRRYRDEVSDWRKR